jgi:hypothetical protein
VGFHAHISGCVFASCEAVSFAAKNEAAKKKTQQEIQKLRDQSNTITVNIMGSNCSIKPVILKRQGCRTKRRAVPLCADAGAAQGRLWILKESTGYRIGFRV